MRKYLLVLISLVCMTSFSSAQENHSPFQVSFAYPLGTNGVNSMNYTSNFSFNILYGMNGGVNGFELGGIFNYNKGGVRGAQIAGIMNMNHRASNGALISGVLNYQKDDFEGFQLSAININLGNFNGAQIGVITLADDFIGAQLGTVSIARDFNGLQGGTISIARDLKGAQLGTINIAHDVNGTQIGTINIARNFRGLQLGVVNVAKKVKGAQIGLINIMGKDKGAIPIGLISVVKNGYYAIEISANEVMYSNLSFKMGVDEFYTIYKVGASLYKGDFLTSYGLGFGTKINLGDKSYLALEASASQIVYGGDWGDNLNLLNRLDLNFHWNLSKDITLLAGPAFNVYVTDKVGVDGFGTLDIPYTFFDEVNIENRVAMWIGANVGLSFRF